MNFDIGFIFQVMGQIIRYVPITIYMAVVSLIIGGMLGLVVALVRYYKVPGLSQLFSIVITILKGVPLILVFLVIFLITSQNFNHFAKAQGFDEVFEHGDYSESRARRKLGLPTFTVRAGMNCSRRAMAQAENLVSETR